MNSIDKLISDTSSAYWWFSVVIVGVLINVASAYLKPYLDVWYGKVSTKRRFKNEQAKAEFEEHAQALANNPLMIIVTGQDELRYRMYGVLFYLIAMALLSVSLYSMVVKAIVPIDLRAASDAALIFIFLCFVVAFWQWGRARRLAELIFAARKLNPNLAEGSKRTDDSGSVSR